MIELLKRFVLGFFGWMSTPYRSCKIRSYLLHEKVRKLHLGSGNNILPGWLNSDLKSWGGRIYIDARFPLPFTDNTFDYIYSEHMIEHIHLKTACYFLKECHRVLKPRGSIRVATPDFDFLIALYQNEKTDVQKRYIEWASSKFLKNDRWNKDIYVINNFVRDWGHQFIFNFDALQQSLLEAGFTTVEKKKVNQSSEEAFKNIEGHGHVIPDEFNLLETLVIEARK